MNKKLTLGEKIKDLRTSKKLKLDDVSEVTGISTSTLQRLEADEDIRVGYQDIETLARYYDVSAVYLFGLTDLRQYCNIEIDKLRLSDEAIAVLKDGKLNNQPAHQRARRPRRYYVLITDTGVTRVQVGAVKFKGLQS